MPSSRWPRRERASTGMPDGLLGMVLMELLRDPSTAERNQQRMTSSRLIWATRRAAVGLCPAFDDFLIWLDPDHEPALKVPVTPEVLEDFNNTIRSLIVDHHHASDRAQFTYCDTERTWILAVASEVATGKIRDGDRLPEQPRLDTVDIAEGVDNAHEVVVTALREFAERHGATYEEM